MLFITVHLNLVLQTVTTSLFEEKNVPTEGLMFIDVVAAKQDSIVHMWTFILNCIRVNFRRVDYCFLHKFTPIDTEQLYKMMCVAFAAWTSL